MTLCGIFFARYSRMRSSLPVNLVTEENGIKLSSNRLLSQGITGCPTRLREQRIRFGPTFDSAGLDAVRAVGRDQQRGEGCPLGG